MTHFKKILAFAALFTIGVAHTKQMEKKTTTAPVTTPMPAPMPAPIIPRTSSSAQASADRPKSQPARAKTFVQLYNEVKNAKNAWDSKTQLLSKTFVDNLLNDAQATHINQDQLHFLLTLAQNYHAQFTGPKKDIDILKELENQREKILDMFSK
jgi:hypothetical protein